MTDLSLEKHRKYLLRYATFHLRDPASAEDAVQETLISALAHIATFEGRSELRTWLTAILKRKIIDQVRQRELESKTAPAPEDSGRSGTDGQFKPNGRWKEPPSDWGEPDAVLESRNFWEVYIKCCQKMPRKNALVFSMREVMGMTSDEICKELEISTTNLHVILYRARVSLQACMTKEWFGAKRS